MMLGQPIFRTFALAAFVTIATTSCSVWADVGYPEPKLDRSSDIAGPDLDGNGVRDDLDNYIDGLPDTARQKQALRQEFAMLRGLTLLDTTDTTAVLDGMRRSIAAISCMYARYGDNEAALRSERIRDVERYSINTKERFMAYARFNSAASGHSAVMPRGDGCELD